MSEKDDIALRKKIAEALLKARKIVSAHKSEYKGVYTCSGGGGTTTSNSSNTVPPDVLAEYNKVVAQANQVAAAPLQQYQEQIVANQNPTETAAYNTINNMQGITAPYTASANNLIGSATQNINPSTVTAANIQNYESPYTQDVLQAAIAAQNNQDAQQQQQLTGNAISAGAWGGDRAGVAQGILGGQQAIANNATNAGILNQGYAQALQEANAQQAAAIQAQEAGQQLQLSGGLAENQLGLSAQQAGLTGANAQLAAGQAQQQQAQAQLNVPYEQFLQQQAYPFQTTGWLGNIAEGIGSNEGGTSTSSTTQPSQGLFGFKKGGIVPKHYADGGNDDDAVLGATGYMLPDGTPDAQERNYGSNPPAGIVDASYAAPAGGIAPPPTPPVNAPDHPANSGYETEMPTPHEANPWLSVAAGVLGTLAGRSRNPLIDIGQGGLIGINNYAQQVAQAEKMNYEEGSFHQNAQKLMDEHEQTLKQFQLEQEKAANEQERTKNEAAHWKATEDLTRMRMNNGLPTVDEFGNIIPGNPNAPNAPQRTAFGFPIQNMTPAAYKQAVATDAKLKAVEDANYAIGNNANNYLDIIEQNLNNPAYTTGEFAGAARGTVGKWLGNETGNVYSNIDTNANNLVNELNKLQYVPGQRASVLGLKTQLAGKPSVDQPEVTNVGNVNSARAKIMDFQLSSELNDAYRQANPLGITDANSQKLDQALKTIYPVEQVKDGKAIFNKDNIQKIRDAIPEAIANPQKYFEMATQIQKEQPSENSPASKIIRYDANGQRIP